MKSITNILRRSNLTPFERVRTLVHNDVHKEKTGKDALSDADIHALTKGWYGSTSEINEYNKYIKIVQVEDSMKMDAQMFLSRSETSILRNYRVLDNFISSSRRIKKISDFSLAEEIPDEDCVSFLIQNTYLEYEKVLHILTFNNLPKKIQSDLALLDPEITHDEQYLADQVFLYEIFKNGNKLNEKDKNIIIDRVYSRMHYESAKRIKNSTAEKDGFLLHSFFAELPVKDLFHKLADDMHLVYENEESLLSAIEKYAKSRSVSIESLIKEKISSWIDDGLFAKDYSPFFLSERFETWSGDTKMNHKELFLIWYSELKKSRKYLKKLFDAGRLDKQTLERDFLGMNRSVEIVTGSSLYKCEEDLDFIKEYKKQTEILTPIANIFLFIEKYATPIKNYRTLCGFKNLSEKVSTTFEIDMTERYKHFIESYEEEVRLLNFNLSRLTDLSMENLHSDKTLNYIISIDELNFKLDKDGETDDIVKEYKEEFKNLKI
jgi:hypothetical protein